MQYDCSDLRRDCVACIILLPSLGWYMAFPSKSPSLHFSIGIHIQKQCVLVWDGLGNGKVGHFIFLPLHTWQREPSSWALLHTLYWFCQCQHGDDWAKAHTGSMILRNSFLSGATPPSRRRYASNAILVLFVVDWEAPKKVKGQQVGMKIWYTRSYAESAVAML